MTDEPDITINGTPLTVAQAMTVRVAVGNFMIDLTQDDDFIRDVGEIAALYRERLKEINILMRNRT